MSAGSRITALALAALALAGAGPAAAAPPNDPFFSDQWALARENVLGALGAWQQSTGQGAIVAVLDTGAALDHPDLRGALWTNPGEIPGNGIDDDHDGYVDDVHGVDLVNGDGDPSDDDGHGTHVAGIIAARAGNGEGGAGLAPGARLMIVKVLDARRAGTAAGLADGIRYAVAHGARIINTSVNGDGTSRALQDAIRAAGAAGALVVASAGNDGRDIDTQPSYPASYPDPAIVSVAAESPGGTLAGFSNRGALSVDLAAPGEDILSTASDGGYELRSGTSMAAPFVSATLALMESLRPDLGGAALKVALLAGATPSAALTGSVATGALNAQGALRALVDPGALRAAASPLGVQARAAHARRGAVLSWSLAGDTAAVATVRLMVDGRVVAERSAAGSRSLRVGAHPGTHRFSVVALDAAGQRLGAADGLFRTARARLSRRAAAARRAAIARRLAAARHRARG